MEPIKDRCQYCGKQRPEPIWGDCSKTNAREEAKLEGWTYDWHTKRWSCPNHEPKEEI